MNFKKWTEAEIEAYRSDAGGWTREALAEIGVNWPPIKGWRRRLLNGEDPNTESLDGTFARLDDAQQWAVRVPCATRELRPGLPVTVRRKDGTRALVHIGSILRQGSNFATCSFY